MRLRPFLCYGLATAAGWLSFVGAAQARLVTEEIQRAIDAKSAAGGGTVTLSAGTYEVGSLWLKDNVTLQALTTARIWRSPLWAPGLMRRSFTCGATVANDT